MTVSQKKWIQLKVEELMYINNVSEDNLILIPQVNCLLAGETAMSLFPLQSNPAPFPPCPYSPTSQVLVLSARRQFPSEGHLRPPLHRIFFLFLMGEYCKGGGGWIKDCPSYGFVTFNLLYEN